MTRTQSGEIGCPRIAEAENAADELALELLPVRLVSEIWWQTWRQAQLHPKPTHRQRSQLQRSVGSLSRLIVSWSSCDDTRRFCIAENRSATF